MWEVREEEKTRKRKIHSGEVTKITAFALPKLWLLLFGIFWNLKNIYFSSGFGWICKRRICGHGGPTVYNNDWVNANPLLCISASDTIWGGDVWFQFPKKLPSKTKSYPRQTSRLVTVHIIPTKIVPSQISASTTSNSSILIITIHLWQFGGRKMASFCCFPLHFYLH